MSSGFNDLIDPDGLLATVLRLRSQEYSLSFMLTLFLSHPHRIIFLSISNSLASILPKKTLMKI